MDFQVHDKLSIHLFQRYLANHLEYYLCNQILIIPQLMKVGLNIVIDQVVI